MTAEPLDHWTKEELKVYVLLLCAKADTVTSKEEIALIQSKTDATTFEKMSAKIAKHSESKSLKKIQRNLIYHHYTHRELSQLRQEMDEIFLADQIFNLREQSMDEILDNILY